MPVENFGVYNSAHGADRFGFRNLKRLFWNLEAPALYEHALANREAQLIRGGALAADTGVHTGRSPRDKFVVRDAKTENEVWWDNNAAITPEQFELLLADFLGHAEGKDLFVQDLFGGADPATRARARVFTEYAWHSLFIRNLLRRPSYDELAGYVPDLTIVDLPSFKAEPARHGTRSDTVIAVDFGRRIVLIGNSSYAGEMKKSVFTYLNYILPKMGIMPMHCSANVGRGGDAAIFSASPAPARRRCRAIRTASCSATTSTAGGRTASSTSRAAAMPRPSACRATPSPRSTPRPSASAPCSRTSCSTRSPGCPISTMRRRPRTRAAPIRSTRRPAAPAIPATSSC